MLLKQRRYLLAMLIVVILGAGIGWSWCDLSLPLAWEHGILAPSVELSPKTAAASPADLPVTMPLTPGTWTWTRKNGTSVAHFADGLVTITCDLSAGTVSISRPAKVAGDSTVTILSSTQTRAFRGVRHGGQIAVTLDASDAFLDALALSRGRFGVAVAGLDALYPASWAEVSRVIEDCRLTHWSASSVHLNSDE